jgi:TPR repeat protein
MPAAASRKSTRFFRDLESLISREEDRLPSEIKTDIEDRGGLSKVLLLCDRVLAWADLQEGITTDIDSMREALTSLAIAGRGQGQISNAAADLVGDHFEPWCRVLEYLLSKSSPASAASAPEHNRRADDHPVDSEDASEDDSESTDDEDSNETEVPEEPGDNITGYLFRLGLDLESIDGPHLERDPENLLEILARHRVVRNKINHERKRYDELNLKIRDAVDYYWFLAFLGPLLNQYNFLKLSGGIGFVQDPASRVDAHKNYRDWIQSKVEEHRDNFAGRAALLEDLRTAINAAISPRSKKAGLILPIHGREQTGKSALIAQMVAPGRGKPFFIGQKTLRTDPDGWAENVIYIPLKPGISAEELTDLLTAEANQLLIDPITGVPSPKLEHELDQNYGDSNKESDSDYREYLEQIKESSLNASSIANHSHVFDAGRLRTIIERLSLERSSTILVLDGLDECKDPRLLRLIDQIPENFSRKICLVVSARSGTEAYKALQRKVRRCKNSAEPLEVPILPQTDVEAKIIELWDGTSDKDRLIQKVNDPAMISNTEGIKDVFIQLEKHGGNADKVEVHATGHDKMAQLWKDNPLLKETLPILALLHPVGPVDLDTLRSIIISRAPEFEALTERGKLHGKLEDVRHQLSGYVSSNYLLENDGFVQFILEGGFHWVDSDWKKEQLNILRHFHVHIEKDEERYSKLLKQVVSSPWSGQITRAELETALGSQETSTGHIDAMNKMLRRLPEQYRDQDLIGVLCSVAVPFEGDYLRDPGASVPSEDTELKLPEEKVLSSLVTLAVTMLDYPKLQVAAHSIIKLVAENEIPQAMGVLGTHLLDGNGLPQDSEEGEKLLRKAAEGGDSDATKQLARRMLDGDGLPQDSEEGERWLRKAVEGGDGWEMIVLAERLLDGHGLPQDSQEGEKLLRKAAEGGDSWAMTWAMMRLADRFFDGRGLPQDSQEGEKWLRKVTESGEILGIIASQQLIDRLLDGKGAPQNAEVNERWLRKATEKDPGLAFQLYWKSSIPGFHKPSTPSMECSAALMKLVQVAQSSRENPATDNVIQLSNTDRKALANFVTQFLRSFVAHIDPSQTTNEALAYLANLFFLVHQQDEIEGGLGNIYYLRRRGHLGDFSPVPCPTLDELESELSEKDDAGAILLMNFALRHLFGVEGAEDLTLAEAHLARIGADGVEEVLGWFHEVLAKKDDPEGHLAVGWMVLRGLTEDPDGWSAVRRFDRVKELGGEVPAALLSSVE